MYLVYLWSDGSLSLTSLSSIASTAQLLELQPQLALQKSVSNLQKPTPVASQEVGLASSFYLLQLAVSHCIVFFIGIVFHVK